LRNRIIGQPSVKIGWPFIERQVERLAKRDLIKLLQDGFMKAFADAVRLRMLRLGLGVLDVIERQVKRIIMRLGLTKRWGYPF